MRPERQFDPKWLDPKAKLSEREASVPVPAVSVLSRVRFLKGPSGPLLGASALRGLGSNREVRSFKDFFI